MLSNRTISRQALLACSIFTALFFSACSDTIKTGIISFRTLDEGLVHSNAVIQRQNELVCYDLEKKLTDPFTAEKAKIWRTKALLVKAFSDNLVNYIQMLKNDLMKEAGFKPEEKIEFRENDKNAVERLFSHRGKGKELFGHLNIYKQDVLAVDSQFNEVFDNVFPLTAETFDSNKDGNQDFTKFFFDDIPSVAALATLSKFQNNVRINEIQIIDFCDNHVVNSAFIFHSYSPFVSQTSSVVGKGQEIEIVAGVSSFSKTAMPEVAINGKNIPRDSDALSHYKFKAVDKPGRHYVSVKISYIDETGKNKQS